MALKLDKLSAIVKKASGEKLFELLNSIEGLKDLVLDKDLIHSLDYIATFSQLKACKVEKVFKLEGGSAPGATNKCVYLMKPCIQTAKIIADHINASQSIESSKKFWIINVPRKLFASDTIFEREGVYGYATQLELPLGFLCLDKDVLSLELDDFFASFFLKGDLTHIHTAAIALLHLSKICGPIPKIFGQGKCAKMVLDMLNLFLQNTETVKPTTDDKISHLIILDRDTDYFSVLLSQLTYEGMLDEFFGIKSGRIVFPKAVTGKEESVKIVLNSSDVIYEEIRNSYFASVFGFLRDKAKEIQAKSETSSMTIDAMKSFVANEMKKLKQQRTSLVLHVGACEVILEAKSMDNFQERLRIERDILDGQNVRDCVSYTEDVINRQDPYPSALRLMCLLSLSQDGLQKADYESLHKQFRQSYGCKHISTMYKLEKLGLLVEQPPLISQGALPKGRGITEAATSKATKIAEKVATAVALRSSSFRLIAKKFNLIPPETDKPDLKNPTNLSYVFGGSYVPLFARITEQIVVHGSLRVLEDSMKLLPGDTIINYKTDKEPGAMPSSETSSKTVLVYVLGGITFAEIAALRMLGKMNDCRILIATTSIISASSLLRTLAPASDDDS